MAYVRVEESEFAKTAKLLVMAERAKAHVRILDSLTRRLEFLGRGKAERYAQFEEQKNVDEVADDINLRVVDIF